MLCFQHLLLRKGAERGGQAPCKEAGAQEGHGAGTHELRPKLVMGHSMFWNSVPSPPEAGWGGLNGPLYSLVSGSNLGLGCRQTEIRKRTVVIKSHPKGPGRVTRLDMPRSRV